MRLVVDASVLVGELLRARGRELLADERLDLFMPELMLAETNHELPRRISKLVEHHGLTADAGKSLWQDCARSILHNVGIVPEAAYLPIEAEARWRSARDESDWPLVASALVLDAAIWTQDNDLLGTGVATWTTQTLLLWLENSAPEL